MATLFDRIRLAVERENYVVSLHADERLRSRRIPIWQVEAGLAHGKPLRQRLNDKPNPVIEVEQFLPDGERIKVVWSWIGPDNTAKLVTVHFFDR